MTTINHITVHCSATRPSQNWGVKEIDRLHRSPPFNWLMVGYHYVIKRDGTVEPGRPESRTGSHVGGRNTGNLGVCLIGGIHETTRAPEANFTDRQYEALARLLDQLRTRYPNATIRGHRDWPNVAKACPCFDVRSWCRANGINPLN